MTAHDNGQHRLEVEDFGPIARADIDLRPLTVFAGPSNSGKSYLAKLMYALHGCFARRSVRTEASALAEFQEGARATPGLVDLLDRLDGYLRGEFTVDETANLEEELAPLTRAAAKVRNVAPLLARELLRVYAAEKLLDLARKPGSVPGFTLTRVVAGSSGTKSHYRHAFQVVGDGLSREFDVSEDAPMRFALSGLQWVHGPDSSHFSPRQLAVREVSLSLARLQSLLAHLSEPCTVGPVSGTAYYLPASRSGLVEGHGALVESSLERLTRGNRRRQGSLLSGVLADFIRLTFVELGLDSSGWESGMALARQVEETILHGTVRVDFSENGTSSIAYRPDGFEKDLPLTRAASMVTEIVPLVLYLRQYVTPGSTIIVEEPEAHMHPAMQVRMATAIATMVEAGIRVIVTTHSEWLLSGLANIVCSARLPGSERQDIAGHGVALSANEVGVWQFEPQKDGGSVTRELILDSEDGMYHAGYPEVGRTLYNDWATIVSRLQED